MQTEYSCTISFYNYTLIHTAGNVNLSNVELTNLSTVQPGSSWFRIRSSSYHATALHGVLLQTTHLTIVCVKLYHTVHKIVLVHKTRAPVSNMLV